MKDIILSRKILKQINIRLHDINFLERNNLIGKYLSESSAFIQSLKDIELLVIDNKGNVIEYSNKDRTYYFTRVYDYDNDSYLENGYLYSEYDNEYNITFQENKNKNTWWVREYDKFNNETYFLDNTGFEYCYEYNEYGDTIKYIVNNEVRREYTYSDNGALINIWDIANTNNKNKSPSELRVNNSKRLPIYIEYKNGDSNQYLYDTKDNLILEIVYNKKSNNKKVVKYYYTHNIDGQLKNIRTACYNISIPTKDKNERH